MPGAPLPLSTDQRVQWGSNAWRIAHSPGLIPGTPLPRREQITGLLKIHIVPDPCMLHAAASIIIQGAWSGVKARQRRRFSVR